MTTVSVVMYLVLDSFHSCYSCCSGGLVGSCNSSFYSFIHLCHINSFLRSLSCFLRTRNKIYEHIEVEHIQMLILSAQPNQDVRKQNYYLDRMKHFRMVDCRRRSREGTKTSWNIKNPILPVTRLSFPSSESINAKSLPLTLMPRSFIAMSISKMVYSKTMHLIRKILSSICIPISA